MKTSQNNPLSLAKLYRRKMEGCYRQFGLIETIRRMGNEIFGYLRKSGDQLDISMLTDKLAIGAALKSLEAINSLKNLGLIHVIDLRAERKQSDPLVKVKGLHVNWVPIYDDWRPKSREFFQQLLGEIYDAMSSKNEMKIFVCCGVGEHRAPLAGVLALTSLGYSVDIALEMVRIVRPAAELLPCYMRSLNEFLASNPISKSSIS